MFGARVCAWISNVGITCHYLAGRMVEPVFQALPDLHGQFRLYGVSLNYQNSGEAIGNQMEHEL